MAIALSVEVLLPEILVVALMTNMVTAGSAPKDSTNPTVDALKSAISVTHSTVTMENV